MGNWRDADDIRTIGLDADLFDAAEAAIPAVLRLDDGDPRVDGCMTPFAVELGIRTLSRPLAVLLAPSIIVVARRAGRVRRQTEVISLARSDIQRCGEPTPGIDCFIVAFDHTAFGECVATFGLLEEAEYLAQNLVAGVPKAPVKPTLSRGPRRHRGPRPASEDRATT
jgi:hypothetical protein